MTDKMHNTSTKYRAYDHARKVRSDATMLYGYRSIESYVATHHDAIHSSYKLVDNIAANLKFESSKDNTLNETKIRTIVEAIGACTRLSEEQLEDYAARIKANRYACNVKKLCLNRLLSSDKAFADCYHGVTYEEAQRLRDMLDSASTVAPRPDAESKPKKPRKRVWPAVLYVTLATAAAVAATLALTI